MQPSLPRSSIVNRESILVGVDVGGTHTDGVLMRDNKILSHFKTATTSDMSRDITLIIKTIFTGFESLKHRVSSINIGTTHLVNALIQGNNFNKTLALRLAAPLTSALPPTVDWSDEAKDQIGRYLQCLIINGGYEYKAKDDSGEPQEVSPLNDEAIKELAIKTLSDGTQAVSITGLFAQIKKDQEEKVAAIFKLINPSLGLSLSHYFEKSQAGLLYRENATILGACLSNLHKRIVEAIKRSIQDLKITTRNVFLTQGDGTKKKIEDSLLVPMLTLDSGPANSIIGASFLTNVDNAIIVDIGGTSTDLGILKQGVPLDESSIFSRGGVSLNFGCFRAKSLSLGGGTKIRVSGEQVKLDSTSVGNKLSAESLVYGGTTLTPTDIAYWLKRIQIDGVSRSNLNKKLRNIAIQEELQQFVERVDKAIHQKLIESIVSFVDTLENVPQQLILVGGGAKLFDVNHLKNDPALSMFNQKIIIPEKAEIANAVGAAKSKIGATYIEVYPSIGHELISSEKDAIEKAKRKAIQEGADRESIRVISVDYVHLSYLPNSPIQIKVSVVGEDQGVANLDVLSVTDINNIARGAGILGSGGGGDPELTRLMTINSIKEGKNVSIISMDALPDNANVVVCVGLGSPYVLYERLFTKHEGVNVLKSLEKKLNRTTDVLIAGEGGGANIIYPLFIGAQMGIPVVDGDCAGRCLPELQMMLPNIYGDIKNTPFALSNGIESQECVATDMLDLEKQARNLAIKMGRVVSVALVPMTGAEVKKWAVGGTISLIQKIGAGIKEGSFDDKFLALNQILSSTEYLTAKKIADGKICGFQRKEIKGFSTGGFLVKNQENNDDILEISFQNENLVARKRAKEKTIEAETPHLITIVEKGTFKIIPCEQLRNGLNVAVLVMHAPTKMLTEKAMKVVGPQAYDNFTEVFKFLDTLEDSISKKPVQSNSNN